ncbi:hypothetical protein [Spirosoma jeollabukense]
MTQTHLSSAGASLLWVEVTAPDVARHWARSSRIFAGVNQPEQAVILCRLKAGQRIDCEELGIILHCPPMSRSDQKRLAHLNSFEEGGFRLTTFRSDTALFHKNGQDYYCLREMVERGYLPTPAIAINKLNTVVTTLDGRLIDVFVPIGLATINFFIPR